MAAGTCDLGFVTTSGNGIATPAITPVQFTGAVEDKTVPVGVVANQSSIFTQADLTGTWYLFQFVSGANPGWLRATYTLDEAGSGTPTDGLGSRISAEMSPISNELDLIIQGDGFFPITLPDGTIGYSRSGTFKRDSTGQIVNANGNPLFPYITIPNNAAKLKIGSDGTVSVQVTGQSATTTIGNIQLASFSNPAGLTSQGKNIFMPTDASGAPITNTPGLNGLGTTGLNANGGTSQFGAMTLNITPSGFVSNSANRSSASRLVMNMSRDKSFMAGVGGDNGDERMSIAVKGGGTFQQSDLAGSWKLHALTAGTARHSWERGDVSVSVSGAISTSNIVNAEGAAAFNIHSEPLIVPTNGDFSGMGVVMSLDKNFMVLVDSNQDGSSSLGLLVKTASSGLSTSDLAGNWRNNSLSISATSNYWYRSLLVFDATGNSNSFARVMNGVVQPDAISNTITVGPSGLINTESAPQFEGVLSRNRKLVIYTQLKGTTPDQFQIGILMK